MQSFVSSYNDIADQAHNDNNELNMIISYVLTNYLSSLSKPQLAGISNNIICKYEENQKKIKQKYLQSIITLIKRKVTQRHFLLWKRPSITKNERSQPTKMTKSHKLVRMPSESFINRQEGYFQKTIEKKKKITSKTEEDLLLQCTFAPKIISTNDQMSPLARSKKAIDRLIEDTNRRRDIHNKKKFESLNKRKSSLSNTTSCGNKKTFDKLYYDAKEREEYKKELQQHLDEQRGITFKPISFTKDSGYEVSTQFEERNKKLLDDRHNFVFVYDYLRQSKHNEQCLNKKNQLIQKAIKENERNSSTIK